LRPKSDEPSCHVTLLLPKRLYEWLRMHCAFTKRSVSQQIKDLVQTMMVAEGSPSPDGEKLEVKAARANIARELAQTSKKLQEIYDGDDYKRPLEVAQILIDYFSKTKGQRQRQGQGQGQGQQEKEKGSERLKPEEVLQLAIAEYIRHADRDGRWTITVDGETRTFKDKFEITYALSLAIQVSELIEQHDRLVETLSRLNDGSILNRLPLMGRKRKLPVSTSTQPKPKPELELEKLELESESESESESEAEAETAEEAFGEGEEFAEPLELEQPEVEPKVEPPKLMKVKPSKKPLPVFEPPIGVGVGEKAAEWEGRKEVELENPFA
jgi:hypothetical protein